MDNGETDADFQWLAQKAHFLFGIVCTVVPSLFAHGLGLTIGFALLLIFAGIKEFYYDARFEDEPCRGSDLRDFSYYALGGVMGVILWCLAVRFPF